MEMNVLYHLLNTFTGNSARTVIAVADSVAASFDSCVIQPGIEVNYKQSSQNFASEFLLICGVTRDV